MPYALRMKVIVVDRYGDPSVLRLVDVAPLARAGAR